MSGTATGMNPASPASVRKRSEGDSATHAAQKKTAEVGKTQLGSFMFQLTCPAEAPDGLQFLEPRPNVELVVVVLHFRAAFLCRILESAVHRPVDHEPEAKADCPRIAIIGCGNKAT